jgi:hypothetical protein
MMTRGRVMESLASGDLKIEHVLGDPMSATRRG